MAELSGDVSKLRVNGFIFKFATADVQEEGTVGDTSNSELETFASQTVTKQKLRVSVKAASLDLANCNPYNAARLNLRVGAEVHLDFYVEGLTGDSYSCVLSIEATGWHPDASHLQPFDFSGHSTGVYLLPGDE